MMRCQATDADATSVSTNRETDCTRNPRFLIPKLDRMLVRAWESLSVLDLGLTAASVMAKNAKKLLFLFAGGLRARCCLAVMLRLKRGDE